MPGIQGFCNAPPLGNSAPALVLDLIEDPSTPDIRAGHIIRYSEGPSSCLEDVDRNVCVHVVQHAYLELSCSEPLLRWVGLEVGRPSPWRLQGKMADINVIYLPTWNLPPIHLGIVHVQAGTRGWDGHATEKNSATTGETNVHEAYTYVYIYIHMLDYLTI